MASRSQKNKIIVYQLLPRLFAKNKPLQQRPFGSLQENGCGKMNDISAAVLKRLKMLGTTHVWYTGIIRHASATDYTAYGIPTQHPLVVKGKAGSPYAIVDYYDIDPDLAEDVNQRKQEFQALVERTHRAGLKVIIDFVPNHVAREYHSVARPEGIVDLGADDDKTTAFSPQNNFYYLPTETFAPTFDIGDYNETPARATGNDCFHAHPNEYDWYETIKLNYGCPPLCTHLADMPTPQAPLSTWKKMADILHHWAGYGIDGFRCDMVHMVPIQFWQWVIPKLKSSHPHLLFIGETYSPELYRPLLQAGFDMLYDKVDMYDTLMAVAKNEAATHDITRAWQHTDDIAEHMLSFIENHDETRLASEFLLGNPYKAMPALLVALCLRTNPFLLYFGQEIGEDGMQTEGFSQLDGHTSIFDYWCLMSTHSAYFARRSMRKHQRQVEQAYQRLLNIAKDMPAIVEGTMFDLMYVNPHLTRQFAFFRQHRKQLLLCVANFDCQTCDTDIHIPAHAIDYLGIKEGDYKGTDLIDGTTSNLHLQSEGNILIDMPAYGTRIIKIG